MRPPSRLDPVQAPVIPWLNHSLAPAHPGTLSLAQGIPWFGPPAEALAALRQAPTHGNYGPSPGLPALLEALRAKLEQDNGITEVPGIMVTAGSNMAFYYTVLAATQPGDEIILPLPYYFNHEMAAVMAGVRVHGVAPGADGVPDPGDVEQAINPATRAVVTVSPNNPTGVVYPQQTLRAINRLCRRYGLLHISDEAYEYFTYGGQRHYSPAAGEDTADCTVSLFSFSKGYGMAGWRVGYVVYPERLAQAMAKLQDTVLIAPPVPCQLAALAALGAGRRYCQERLPPSGSSPHAHAGTRGALRRRCPAGQRRLLPLRTLRYPLKCACPGGVAGARAPGARGAWRLFRDAGKLLAAPVLRRPGPGRRPGGPGASGEGPGRPAHAGHVTHARPQPPPGSPAPLSCQRNSDCPLRGAWQGR